jgi:C-terminal processing protease CtpA/Prc
VQFTTSDSSVFSRYVEANARQLSATHGDTVVIDLRGNKGGHFWAFFASLLPILPNGTYGSFRIGKESLPWRVRGNAVYEGSQLVYSLKQNVPKWKPKKIICLSDNYTGSSAEALLIALRSLGTKVVVFGKPTYGATSVTQEFPLPDYWKLKLPVGWFCNSAGQPITGRIYPDSTVGQTLCL